MKKILIPLLLLLSFYAPKMEAQKNEAADEILFKIVKAEIAVKENAPLNQYDLREIVCLTNIPTEKWDGNFIGAFYSPTSSEIQQWKAWFEKNKDRITYSLEIIKKKKLIQFEYENGKFRNINCL